MEYAKEVTWLSPIIIVLKKNGKLRIYKKKLNVTTKKYSYPLPFIDDVLNTILRYEAYFFLDGYLGYHQISIALKYRYKITFFINYKAFICKVMLFGVKNGPPTYEITITIIFR
jgi:hypothetical protein